MKKVFSKTVVLSILITLLIPACSFAALFLHTPQQAINEADLIIIGTVSGLAKAD